MIWNPNQPKDEKEKRGRDEWGTPQWFFDYLTKEFSIVADVCATAENARCDQYITKEEDALSVNWIERWRGKAVFMNPPFSRIKEFGAKAVEEAFKGMTVLGLTSVDTTTEWWWEYVRRAVEIRFIRPRLSYEGAVNSATFPSCLIVWGPDPPRAVDGPKHRYWDLRSVRPSKRRVAQVRLRPEAGVRLVSRPGKGRKSPSSPPQLF